MRRHQVLLVAAVFMLAGVACSSDSTEPAGGAQTSASEPADSTSTPAAAAGELSIVDFAFDPPDVLAGEGGALTVTNNGETSHTFTMDDGSQDEELAPGESVDVVIGEAGGFHCEIHPSMTGTIETE